MNAANSSPFNAADYDEAAGDFFREAKFELARRALVKCKELRARGDLSTVPTKVGPYTAEDYERHAKEFESAGDLRLAAACRAAADKLRITRPEKQQ